MPETRKAVLYAFFSLAIVSALVSATVSFLLATDQAADDLELQTRSRIQACEFVKLDRIDNARAWTAMAKAERRDSLDPATIPSERERSAIEAAIYSESARQLRARLYECEPLVRHNRRIIDPEALRDARGGI